MRCAILCLLLGTLVSVMPRPASSQDSTFAPAAMAWADLFPWFYTDGEDGVQGFAVDLIAEIGAEVGFDIEPFDVVTYPAWGQAQSSGTSVLLPAVARLPGLVNTNVFSDPVLTTQVRLAIPIDAISDFDPTNLEGKKVGVLSPGAGSDPRLLPGATLIKYPNLDSALVALLSGEVDALSAEATFVFAEAYRAQLDQRIAFVGAPLQSLERYIAVHESRAELLEPINAALAGMKADGRLETLFARYNVFPPPPPPDVLKVGIFQLEPYMSIDNTGAATGFAVDVLRDVTELAGLEIEFVPIEMSGLVPGPTHDILPVVSITPERAQIMDFAFPIESSEFSIFVRSGDADSVRGLADLEGRNVGVYGVSIAKKMAERAGLTNTTEFSDNSEVAEILRALDQGDIDAFLFENTSVRRVLEFEGLNERIAEIRPPFLKTQRAPALRFGLGLVREKLNIVLPSYVVSDEYSALRAKYFDTPTYWTPARIRWTVGVSLAAFLLLAFSALLVQIRTLRRAAQAERTAAELNRLSAEQGRELETVFNAATSGIVAINDQGQVVRANQAARHMLGGVSEATPFVWPEQIRFIEPETMQPLDNSADPLRRAMSGNSLQKETHLMQRVGAGDDRRYVRIDSAELINEGEHLIVLVIDDVSNEERNRQVVERKSRLDALGQLTGGIAHDFNNLLTSLLYGIVLAQRSEDAVDRIGHLKEAENSINRGRSLTSRLLAFASKQPGLAESRTAARVFSDFEVLIRPMLEASIDMTSDIKNAGLIVYCDQTQLESALMNLVLNSRDAILRAGKGNRITLKARAVSAREEEDTVETKSSEAYRFVEISVTDNGPGMDDETLSRATDPFFTTKATNSGTGLGLAMVYGFARQAAGDFRIYSEPDVGTTVRLILPRGTKDGFREAPVAGQEIVNGAGQTILLVEDEYHILKVASKLLKDIGYGVLTAKSGREALDVIASGKSFDLLLTDVVMPGEIGGFELARRVKETRPDMPVLYMSGYTGFTSNEMGEVVAPLLQKPTPPIELSRALALALTATE